MTVDYDDRTRLPVFATQAHTPLRMPDAQANATRDIPIPALGQLHRLADRVELLDLEIRRAVAWVAGAAPPPGLDLVGDNRHGQAVALSALLSTVHAVHGDLLNVLRAAGLVDAGRNPDESPVESRIEAR